MVSIGEKMDWVKRRDARRKYRERQERELRRRRKMILQLAAFILCAIAVGTVTVLASGQDMAEPGGESGGNGVSRSPGTSEVAEAPVSGISVAKKVKDPLLVLVNQEHPLPDDWQPDLLPIAPGNDEQVDARICQELNAMTEAARREGVWFWVTSGYRSRELQQEILDRKIRENMGQGMTEQEARADALRTIQEPGSSEHHTGLAVDFNDAAEGFDDTDASDWLARHAAEYGFIQRYKYSKSAITGIDNESWHYRYVGKEHAAEMERLDMCLEEYVEYLNK